MTSKWVMAISIVIAALILPQALAASVGFSVPAGSTSSTFSSTPGGEVRTTSFGNTNVLGGSGLIIAPLGGSVSQYYEWISTDETAKAAAFAYMQGSSSYQYQFTGSRGSTWARANLKFSATEAEDYLLGGFAFNPTNYAGALLSGEWADSIKYSNSLYASSTGVSATQSFSGTDFEELGANTWAERGYVDYEFTEEGDIDPFVTTDWDPEPGYWYEYGPSNAITSEQYMWLDDGDILNPYKPYKATASLSSNTASSSQSVALNGAIDDTAYVSFWSWATLGDYYDGDQGYEANTYMGADGVTEKLGNVVYSSSSKATTALATARQNVNVYKADYIYTYAESDNFDDELDAYESIYVHRYADGYNWCDGCGDYHWEEVDSGIYSSMIGSDSATARAGLSSVTQQLTKVSGAYIDKWIDANNDDLDYYVEDETNIFDNIEVEYAIGDEFPHIDSFVRTPEKASTLSGTSTATATLTGAAITGAWKASIAKDISDYQQISEYYLDFSNYVAYDTSSFTRRAWGENGGDDGDVKGFMKSTTKASIPYYYYREFDRANELGII